MPDLPQLGHTGLVDLLVLGTAVLAAVGALRHRRGLLGAAGAVVGSLVVAWLVAVAMAVWGPPPVSHEVRESTFVHTFPVPERALADVDRLDALP